MINPIRKKVFTAKHSNLFLNGLLLRLLVSLNYERITSLTSRSVSCVPATIFFQLTNVSSHSYPNCLAKLSSFAKSNSHSHLEFIMLPIGPLVLNSYPFFFHFQIFRQPIPIDIKENETLKQIVEHARDSTCLFLGYGPCWYVPLYLFSLFFLFDFFF